MASSGSNQSKKNGGSGRTRRRSQSDSAASKSAVDLLAERVREVRDAVSGVVEKARQQAIEKSTEGARVLREEVEEYAASKKGAAAARVEGVGDTVRQAARNLRLLRMDPVAEYLDRATDVIQDSADYLEERDVTQIAEDLAALVRRYPGIFLSTLLITGFGAARFVKASDPRGGAQPSSTNRGGRTKSPVRRRAGRSIQNGRTANAS